MLYLAEATGVAGLVSALTSAFDLDTMLGTLTQFVPWIAICLIFSFIWGIVKKSTKGLPKGKVRM